MRTGERASKRGMLVAHRPGREKDRPMIAPLLAAWLQVAWYPTSGTPVMAAEHSVTYDIAGTTTAELWQDIARHGPVDPATGAHFAGDLRWEVRWNYHLDDAPGSCRVGSIDVTIESTMTIPRWTNAGLGPEALQVAWSVFLSRLKLHESGHRDNAVKAAQAVREAIAGAAGQAATCGGLAARLNAAAHDAFQHWKKLDQDYDASTRHGITQGAVLGDP